METIPAIYWMILIGVVTGFICLILYYIAMLLKETKETVTEAKYIVRESKGLVKHANKMLEEATEIVGIAKKGVIALESIVHEVKDQIIKPIRSIGNVFSTFSSLLEGFKGK